MTQLPETTPASPAAGRAGNGTGMADGGHGGPGGPGGPGKDTGKDTGKSPARGTARGTVAAVPIRPVPAPSAPDPAALHAPHAPRPPVRRARLRRRHWLALLGLLLMVVAPTGATVWYLWVRAADQFASEAAFSIRQEEGVPSAAGLLGGLAQITGRGGGGGDAEIIYQLLHSQDFVAGVDAALDLRRIWSRPGLSWARGDPLLAFDPSGSLEDLRAYWQRMVRVAHDSGSGLVTLRVRAFRPEDATAIAREILTRSEAAINALNEAARADALRHADEDLALAQERLKAARAALRLFRSLHQIIDPGIDLQAQSGLIGTLQGQLAQAMIEADLLHESAAPGDPRLAQALRRIEVIRARIAGERRHLGPGGDAGADAGGDAGGDTGGSEEGGSEDLAALVGDYEGLVIDEEFAAQSWLAAMAARDAARAGAARQSRWLAAHVPPSLAESARYPERGILAGLVALFALLAWAIMMLVVWSLRDRR